jgi:hypothetical protein
MTKKEILNLKKGDILYHNYYGKCYVIKIKFADDFFISMNDEIFGAIIQLTTLLDMELLFFDSSTKMCYLLENNLKCLKLKNEENRYNKFLKNNEMKHLAKISLTILEEEVIKNDKK